MSAHPCSNSEVLSIAGYDPLIRRELTRLVRAWRDDDPHNDATALLTTRPHHRHEVLALGSPAEAAKLACDVLANLSASSSNTAPPDLPGLTVPRHSEGRLSFELRPVNYWDFMMACDVPAEREHEDKVAWLGDEDAEEIRDLLDASGPGVATRPGDAKVLRWAGIRDDDGRLLACLAETTPRADGDGSGQRPSAHLSAIATHPLARGRGLGSAITARATRWLLTDGHDSVTLGMYAENNAARGVYERLGFTVLHRLASGAVSDEARPLLSSYALTGHDTDGGVPPPTQTRESRVALGPKVRPG